MPEWNFLKDGDGAKADFKRLPNGNLDPVFKFGDKYVFCDETWSDSFGPFDTYEEAENACKEYLETI